jgi:HK97 gp10 family phage protein
MAFKPQKIDFGKMADKTASSATYKKGFLTVKVSGLKELDIALNAIDLDLRKKTLAKASKKAMEPVLDRVKNNLRAMRMRSGSTGGLYDTARMSSTSNLKKLAKVGRKAAMVTSVSAGRGGKRRKGATGHQALQLEYGTEDRRAQPFMRPAIVGKEKVVIMHFRRHLRVGIEKTAKQQERRNRRKLKNKG